MLGRHHITHVDSENVMLKWSDVRSGTEWTCKSEILFSILVRTRSKMLPWLWVGTLTSWLRLDWNTKSQN